MSWIKITKPEAKLWNEKLKSTTASFFQFPYYVSSEYSTYFSRSVFIKFVRNGEEIAYAAVIEIGFSLFKVGIIEDGPVLLLPGINVEPLMADLKKFARKRGYAHLQIKPPAGSAFYNVLKEDKDFELKNYFPYHLKVGFDFNIYNKPEKELLEGFKAQGRRKIVLADRIPFLFKKAGEKDIPNIHQLFNTVTNTKGYNFLPFKIYELIYKEGKKYNLCDWYTVYLNNELVNAVLIVKDGRSFYHYTSAFIVKGYPANQSPPAKLHFYIMKDGFYNEHKEHYNISFGGNENLIRFKELFNPVEIEKPAYRTFVIKRNTLKKLSVLSVSATTHFRNFFKIFDKLFRWF